jgi:hypothetical protein
MWRKIIIGILIAAFCTAIGKAVVSVFGLDLLAAEMIQTAMHAEWVEAVLWALSGTMGLLSLAAWKNRSWLRHYIARAFPTLDEISPQLRAERLVTSDIATPPAYAEWDAVETLTLWQVACLWAGTEPISPVPPGAPTARLGVLQVEVIGRRLTPVPKTGLAGKLELLSFDLEGKLPPHEPGERVTRAELKRFFAARKERPKFLFPEVRA